jgi:hypothetical protein
MIVEKKWITNKRIYSLPGYRYKESKWTGWFLFGFIPLFIRCDSVTYLKILD